MAETATISINPITDGDLTWDQIDQRAKSLGKNRSSYTIDLYKKDLNSSYKDYIIEYLLIMNLMALTLLSLLFLHIFGVI